MLERGRERGRELPGRKCTVRQLLFVVLKLSWIVQVKSTGIFLHDTTVIHPFPLLFFGGEISVQKDEGQETIAVDKWIIFQAPKRIAELVKVWVSLIDLNSCQGREEFNVNGFPIHPSFHMAIWTDQLAGWVHVYPSQQVWLPLHSHCRPFSSIAMWVWQTTWKKWTIMVNKKEALLHICFALYWTRKEMSVMELASRPDHVPHTSLFVTRYNSFFDTLIWISNYNYLNKSTF